MKKNSDSTDMRDEYSFRGGRRGRYAELYSQGVRFEIERASPAELDLQSWLGHALGAVQELESTLVIYYALAKGQPTGTAAREAIKLLTSSDQASLHSALSDLWTIHYDRELEQSLVRVSSQRNWLVHKSWSEFLNEQGDPADLAEILLRVESIAADAQSANETCLQLLRKFLEWKGLSAQEIEQRGREVKEHWLAA